MDDNWPSAAPAERDYSIPGLMILRYEQDGAHRILIRSRSRMEDWVVYSESYLTGQRAIPTTVIYREQQWRVVKETRNDEGFWVYRLLPWPAGDMPRRLAHLSGDELLKVRKDKRAKRRSDRLGKAARYYEFILGILPREAQNGLAAKIDFDPEDASFANAMIEIFISIGLLAFVKIIAVAGSLESPWLDSLNPAFLYAMLIDGIARCLHIKTAQEPCGCIALELVWLLGAKVIACFRPRAAASPDSQAAGSCAAAPANETAGELLQNRPAVLGPAVSSAPAAEAKTEGTMLKDGAGASPAAAPSLPPPTSSGPHVVRMDYTLPDIAIVHWSEGSPYPLEIRSDAPKENWRECGSKTGPPTALLYQGKAWRIAAMGKADDGIWQYHLAPWPAGEARRHTEDLDPAAYIQNLNYQLQMKGRRGGSLLIESAGFLLGFMPSDWQRAQSKKHAFDPELASCRSAIMEILFSIVMIACLMALAAWHKPFPRFYQYFFPLLGFEGFIRWRRTSSSGKPTGLLLLELISWLKKR